MAWPPGRVDRGDSIVGMVSLPASFKRAFLGAQTGFAFISSALVALALSPCSAAQTGGLQDGPLPAPAKLAAASQPAPVVDNQAILRMHGAGLGDDLLLQTIQLQPGEYRTSPDDLIALKQAGLSDRVISAMQAHGTGLHQRSETAASGAPAFAQPSRAVAPVPVRSAPIEPAPLAPGIDELGVYYKDKDGHWQPLQTERVEFRSGGWVKSTFTHNIVKQDLNGWVDEKQSSLVLPAGAQILIYMPSGTQPEEYDLLRFREHDKSREFRVKTGGVFHSQTGTDRDDIEFHATKLAAGMYVFTVPRDIEKGEYGVLPPGSTNQRGLADAGKIFTFSIRD